MGNLYVVSTPIGNLEDITLRALKTLKEADLILCEDTRVSIKLLNHYEIKNKLIAYHKFNEQEKTNDIINKLKDGLNIALISDAGTPCICDPGYILIKKAKEEGINVLTVGGISALISALSVSGLKSDNFTFYGFFPRENKDKSLLIEDIKNSNVTTFIFYESPKRIIKTLEFIKENLNDVTISISKELTKLNEQTLTGNINEIIEILKQNDKTSLGEYVFIIEKQNEAKEEETASVEALLVDEIIKNKISMKEAINKLNEENKNLSKKDIYNASLNLKNIL